MASSPAIEVVDHRSGAEVYTGHEVCEGKAREILLELGLPDGLLPLPSLEEVGYNRATGFLWLRQTQSDGVTHTFEAIDIQVSYAGEVTALVEQGRLHSLTGVKSKAQLIWITIAEMLLSRSGAKVVFRTDAALGRAFPCTAFQVNPPALEVKPKAAEEGVAAAATAN